MKKLVLPILASLIAVAVISGVAIAGHSSKSDDGVPSASLNGNDAAKGLKIGHTQLKNSVIDCQKLVPKLRPRVCGPLPTVTGQPGGLGPAGPSGPAGKDGANGPAGAPGAKGATGATGPVGPGCTVPVLEVSAVQDQQNACQGPPGAKGDTGPKGDEGSQGETGPPGDKGDIGPRGYKGEPGTDGTNGKDGADGKDGLGNDTLVICLDGKGGINQAPCNGEQTPVTVVIVNNA